MDVLDGFLEPNLDNEFFFNKHSLEISLNFISGLIPHSMSHLPTFSGAGRNELLLYLSLRDESKPEIIHFAEICDDYSVSKSNILLIFYLYFFNILQGHHSASTLIVHICDLVRTIIVL